MSIINRRQGFQPLTGLVPDGGYKPCRRLNNTFKKILTLNAKSMFQIILLPCCNTNLQIIFFWRNGAVKS